MILHHFLRLKKSINKTIISSVIARIITQAVNYNEFFCRVEIYEVERTRVQAQRQHQQVLTSENWISPRRCENLASCRCSLNFVNAHMSPLMSYNQLSAECSLIVHLRGVVFANIVSFTHFRYCVGFLFLQSCTLCILTLRD